MSATLRRAIVVGLAAVCLVLLAACSSTRTEVVTVTVKSETQAASTEPPAEPAEVSPGMTPERYQELLSKGSRRIDRAIRRLLAANTYERLRKRSEAARRTTFEVATRLEGVTPPPVADEGHAAQVAALKSLATSLAKTTNSIESGSVCTAPALRERLGTLVAADKLKRARRVLGNVGFDVPTLVPPPVSKEDRSLENGTYVVDEDRSGYGRLTIENGLVVDGVVAVIRQGEQAVTLAIYVQAKSSATATGIPDGTYEVAFTHGKDWDSGLGRFARKCGFTKFDEPFPYVTTAETYPGWRITLQPVAGGSATTSPVSPDAFPSVGQG